MAAFLGPPFVAILRKEFAGVKIQRRLTRGGSVVVFRVNDVSQARARMEAESVEFLSPIQISEAFAWSHFRGPDGSVHKIIGQA